MLISAIVHYGMGKHDSEISPKHRQLGLYWFWVSIWIYYLGQLCVKISALMQYLRIAVHDAFRTACLILLAIVLISGCWAFLSACFMCTPIERFWNDSLPGSCLSRLGIW